MWITESGPISEHVEMLGSMAFPCFTVTGEQSAMIDAAITAIAPLMEELFAEDRPLDQVLLTHSHYDHVGALGLLRGLRPELTLLASAEAQRILAKDTVHKFILDMNRNDEKGFGYRGAPIPLAASDLWVDRVLGDGDIVELGRGVSIEAIAAPGHTRCSMVFLVRPDKVLIGGESLGAYVSPEEIQAQSVSSFRDYIASLERIAELDFEAIALPHHGVRRGPEVRDHARVAIRCAEDFRAKVLAGIDAGADAEQLAAELAGQLRHGLSAMQPEKAFRINLASMIRVILAERAQEQTG